ncbi:hypothetical protein WA1_07085 [Scytonema hofmannii PCC 7110]|uniref:Uncharacterized protein n=1 Tax=Scytonema hofmannii PCC 7110 TaxID=128403 RepID=A0A139WT32_9CYAN|nr:hypothetical protein WA1_07085 [Scytonema hofmannii PCC 7110]
MLKIIMTCTLQQIHYNTVVNIKSQFIPIRKKTAINAEVKFSQLKLFERKSDTQAKKNHSSLNPDS